MAISIISGFGVTSAQPADLKSILASSSSLTSISSSWRYNGMMVYTQAEAQLWQLIGGVADSNWVLLSNSGSQTSSSYALTASYALNGGGGSGTGSISASYAVTASYSPLAGFATSASYAFTSSYEIQLQTSTSFASSSISASYSITSSFSISASFVPPKTHVEFGMASGSSFSGTPMCYNVSYINSFPNTIYTVSIIGDEARIWTTANRSTNGFTINSNSNIPLTQMIMWRVEG